MAGHATALPSPNPSGKRPPLLGTEYDRAKMSLEVIPGSLNPIRCRAYWRTHEQGHARGMRENDSASAAHFHRLVPGSGFRKRGLANGVSQFFFSENETKKGRKRKNGKKTEETERKRKKTEKNRKRHRSGDPFCETPTGLFNHERKPVGKVGVFNNTRRWGWEECFIMIIFVLSSVCNFLSTSTD